MKATNRTVMKKTVDKNKDMRPTEKAMSLTKMHSNSDYFGSYTGKPKNQYERPIQDADDL